MPKILLAMFAASFLAACDGGSKLQQMSDFELSEKYAYCLDKNPTSPGKATACENIRRECESRREQLGSFVCRTQ
jgi:hypothetical protein